MLVLFNNLTSKDKNIAVERLIHSSTPRQDFFFMVILSVATATFGLLQNSTAVIIGSMLIAPLLYPVLSLSLGITMSDQKLIARSANTIIKSFAYGVGVSAAVTLLFSNNLPSVTPEILARTQATLPNIAIAVIAGFAASFALVKPELNETLPGIAISVSIIPPLAVTGIGIAKLNAALVSGSFLLLIVNIIGIAFASMLTFSMMDFYVKRRKADEYVMIEDKKTQEEERYAKKKIASKK